MIRELRFVPCPECVGEDAVEYCPTCDGDRTIAVRIPKAQMDLPFQPTNDSLDGE